MWLDHASAPPTLAGRLHNVEVALAEGAITVDQARALLDPSRFPIRERGPVTVAPHTREIPGS